MPKERGVVRLESGKLLIYGKKKGYTIGQKPRFLLKPKMDVTFETRGNAAVNISQVPRLPAHRPRKYE